MHPLGVSRGLRAADLRSNPPPPGSVTSVSWQQKRASSGHSALPDRATIPPRLRPPRPRKSEQDTEPTACRTAGLRRAAVCWLAPGPGHTAFVCAVGL